MTIYLIRHNQDHSYTGNKSFWYGDYFSTIGEAVDAIRTRNDADTFIGWKEIEKQIKAIRKLAEDMPTELGEHYQTLIDHLQGYSPSDDDAASLTMQAFDCNHNLVWTEGETSFDYGDFTESIEEYEVDDVDAVMSHLRQHPKCDAGQLLTAIENEELAA